jgi:prepilin-type N-terminal cleavage/methylation domain-containing protein
MRVRIWSGRGQGGFTLMELLISVTILGLVMAGLLGLLTASQNAYSRGSSTIEAQQNARLALDRMGKEIREAGYHPRPPDTSSTCPPGPPLNLYPGGGGNVPCWSFYPIVAPPPATSMPTTTALTLQYDWNGNGVIDVGILVNDPAYCAFGTPACRGEQVTYAYSLVGMTLTRQELVVDVNPLVVAGGLRALTFTYWREDNPATVPPTHRVATSREQIRSVQIVLQATAANVVPPTTITMMDQIRLRTR